MANSGNNVRSAATTNGTEFWIAGAGGGDGGRRLVQHARRGRAARCTRRVDARTTSAGWRSSATSCTARRTRARSTTCSRSASARRRRPVRPRPCVPGLPTSGGSPLRVRAVRPARRALAGIDTLYVAEPTRRGCRSGRSTARRGRGMRRPEHRRTTPASAASPATRRAGRHADGEHGGELAQPAGRVRRRPASARQRDRGRHRARRTPRSAASPSRRTSPRRSAGDQQRGDRTAPPRAGAGARRSRSPTAASAAGPRVRRRRRAAGCTPRAPRSAGRPARRTVLADGGDARLDRAHLVVARDRLDASGPRRWTPPAPSRRCSCCPRGTACRRARASARSRGIGASVQSSNVTPPSPERQRHARGRAAVAGHQAGDQHRAARQPRERAQRAARQRDRCREASCRRRG